MVGDRVRSRVLAVAILLLIFIFVFSIVIPSLLSDPRALLKVTQVSEITLSVPPSQTVFFGDPLASADRPIKLRVVNSKGAGVAGVPVTMTVQTLVRATVPQTKEASQQNNYYDAALYFSATEDFSNECGKYEALSVGQYMAQIICTPHLQTAFGTSLVVTSGTDGTAIFSDATLLTGYPGRYSLLFTTGSKSANVTVTMRSRVAEITPLSRAPITGTIGVSLSTAAVILVTGPDGAPVAGRTCLAFTQIGVQPVLTPFGLLRNNFATTNATGHAVFNTMMFTTMSGNDQQISFFCDAVRKPWLNAAGDPKIRVVPPTATSVALLDASYWQGGLSIVEGQTFTRPLRVQVTGAGAAVTGYRAFAGVVDDSVSYGKVPINGVSAKCGSDGICEISNLGFAVPGPTGLYKVAVNVNGVSSAPFVVTVTTSVTRVTWGGSVCTIPTKNTNNVCYYCPIENIGNWIRAPLPPGTAPCGDLMDFRDLSPVDGTMISVENAEGKGIRGKAISMSSSSPAIVPSLGFYQPLTSVEGLTNTYNGLLNFIPASASNETTFALTISVDGVPAAPVTIHSAAVQYPAESAALSRKISSITVASPFPATAGLRVPWFHPGMTPHPAVRVVNRLGQPLEGERICMVVMQLIPPALEDYYPGSNELTLVYETDVLSGLAGFYSQSFFDTCPMTDVSGIAVFNGTGSFTHGLPCTAHLRFLTPTDLGGDHIFANLGLYVSETVTVTVASSVAAVDVLAAPPVLVAPDTPLSLTIRASDAAGGPVTNARVEVHFEVYPLAPVDDHYIETRTMFGVPSDFFVGDGGTAIPPLITYLGNISESQQFELYRRAKYLAETTSTDAQGLVSCSFSVPSFYPGRFLLRAYLDGVWSSPIQFDVATPVASLSITRQPQLTTGCCLGDVFDVQPAVSLLDASQNVVSVARNAYVKAEVSRGDVVLFNWWCEAINGVADWSGPLCRPMGVLASSTSMQFAIRFSYEWPGTGTILWSAYSSNVTIDDYLVVRGDLANTFHQATFNTKLSSPITLGLSSYAAQFNPLGVSYPAKVQANAVNTRVPVFPNQVDSHPMSKLTSLLRIVATSPLNTATTSVRLTGNEITLAAWEKPLQMPGDLLPVEFTFSDFEFQSGMVGPYILAVELTTPWRPRLPLLPIVASLDNTAKAIVLIAEEISVPLFRTFTATMQVIDAQKNGIVGAVVEVVVVNGPATPVFRPAPLVASQDTDPVQNALQAITQNQGGGKVSRGVAVFESLQFIAAPAGVYELKFRTEKVLSGESLIVTVDNPIAGVTIARQPRGLKKVVVFDVSSVMVDEQDSMEQPVLLVVDKNGKSLPNVKYYLQVAAFQLDTNGAIVSKEHVAELSYEADTFGTTDANGKIALTSLMFADANNANHVLQFKVCGIASAYSASLPIVNRQRPSDAGVSNYANYVYVTAAVVTPFLIGNSDRVHIAFTFIATVLALGYLGVFNWIFAHPALSQGLRVNVFGAVLIAMFNACLMAVCCIFIALCVLAVVKKTMLYYQQRSAHYKELVKLLLPTGFANFRASAFQRQIAARGRAEREYRGVLEEEKEKPPPPPGCCPKTKYVFQMCGRGTARRVRGLCKKKPNFHAPYEGKTAFFFSVRFLVGITVGVLFCVVALLFCIVMLLWADYAVAVLETNLTNIQLSAEGLLRNPVFDILNDTNVGFLLEQKEILESYAASFGVSVPLITSILEQYQVVDRVESLLGNTTVAATLKNYGSRLEPLVQSVDDLYDKVTPVVGTLIGQLADITTPLTGGKFDISTVPTTVLTTMRSLRGVIDDFVGGIRAAVLFAGITAAAVAFLATLLTLYLVATSYRKSIMKMRQGKDVLKKEDQHPVHVIKYIGLQIGCATATFLLIYFMLAPILFIIYWTPIRVFIWNRIKAILATLVAVDLSTKVILALLPLVGHAFITKDEIKHPRVFFLFDVVFIFIGCVAAVTTVIRIVAVSLFTTVLNVARVDNPTHPAFASYAAMLLLDHRYNNPIASTLTNEFKEHMKAKRQQAEEAQKKFGGSFETGSSDTDDPARVARARFLVAITVHNNPSIRELRKHELARFNEDASDASNTQTASDTEAMIMEDIAAMERALAKRQDELRHFRDVRSVKTISTSDGSNASGYYYSSVVRDSSDSYEPSASGSYLGSKASFQSNVSGSIASYHTAASSGSPRQSLSNSAETGASSLS